MPAEAAALPAPEVELALQDGRWADALGGEAGVEALAREAAALAAGAAALQPEGWSISLLFAGDAEVAELNARFRDKAGATNVLSWPAFDLRPEAPGERPDIPPRPAAGAPWAGEAESLGDVALAFETVAREARARGLPLRVHALHLCVHGMLHLLGYDHERPGDAALMERLEREALLAAGHADPYLAEEE
jgi:probable rRNA maturation factor